jgi:hypothetical protein
VHQLLELKTFGEPSLLGVTSQETEASESSNDLQNET